MYQSKNWWISLILILIQTNSLFADQVIYLDKNKPAPYPGYLFPPDQAKDLRVKLLDLQTDEVLIQSYQKSLGLYQQIIDADEKKVTLAVTQVDKLSSSLEDERSFSDWKKLGWFGTGVLTTILILYGVSKVPH